MQEDLDFTTRNRNELEREIQGLCTTIRKNTTIMETQRVDLSTYKTSLGRLEDKYNDVVAELDEANNEIVEREAGIEKTGAGIFNLRAQVDRLNRD
jgi:flagellar capping protein FliD